MNKSAEPFKKYLQIYWKYGRVFFLAIVFQSLKKKSFLFLMKSLIWIKESSERVDFNLYVKPNLQ